MENLQPYFLSKNGSPLASGMSYYTYHTNYWSHFTQLKICWRAESPKLRTWLWFQVVCMCGVLIGCLWPSDQECESLTIRNLFRVLKIVLAVAPVRLYAVCTWRYHLLGWVRAVTALTRSHSDIARIGTIKPHTMVFELPFPAKFVVRVFFLSLDSVECWKLGFFFEVIRPKREIQILSLGSIIPVLSVEGVWVIAGQLDGKMSLSSHSLLYSGMW